MLRLASVLWRLRRASGIETALFEAVISESAEGAHSHSRLSFVGGADLSEHNQLHLLTTRQPEAVAENKLDLNAKKDIADGFLRLAALPTIALDRLSRYEHLHTVIAMENGQQR